MEGIAVPADDFDLTLAVFWVVLFDVQTHGSQCLNDVEDHFVLLIQTAGGKTQTVVEGTEAAGGVSFEQVELIFEGGVNLEIEPVEKIFQQRTGAQASGLMLW